MEWQPGCVHSHDIGLLLHTKYKYIVRCHKLLLLWYVGDRIKVYIHVPYPVNFLKQTLLFLLFYW